MAVFRYFRGVKTGFVATIGFFDGVHLGHQHLIRQVTDEAVRRGLRSLAVSFDSHPRSVFAPDSMPPLLTTSSERRAFLSKCALDEIVFLRFDKTMASMTALDFMRHVLRDELNVRVLIIGYDHHFGRPQFVHSSGEDCAGQEQEAERQEGMRAEGFEDYVRYGRDMGIEVLLASELPGDEHISSSVIRRSLAEGDIAAANRALGRPYRWSGRVVHGQAIGHRLGFPTANLEGLDPEKIIPGRGVYAIWVKADVEGGASGPLLPAMLNIGKRPTMGGNAMSIEAHLLDFAGDLYGQQLTLFFVERIRSERRFESEQDLARQLSEDRLKTFELLHITV